MGATKRIVRGKFFDCALHLVVEFAEILAPEALGVACNGPFICTACVLEGLRSLSVGGPSRRLGDAE